MSWRYNRHTDRMTGHDFPGVGGNGLDWFVRDELELGARVALRLGEEDQAWWALHELRPRRLEAALKRIVREDRELLDRLAEDD